MRRRSDQTQTSRVRTHDVMFKSYMKYMTCVQQYINYLVCTRTEKCDMFARGCDIYICTEYFFFFPLSGRDNRFVLMTFVCWDDKLFGKEGLGNEIKIIFPNSQQ